MASMWCSLAAAASGLVIRSARRAIGRAEWVSLESVPGMIAGGEVWNSGSVVGLLQALAEKA